MYTTLAFVAGAIFGSVIMGLLRVAKKVSPPPTSRKDLKAAITQRNIYGRIKNALEDFNASRIQAAGPGNVDLNEIYVISCSRDDGQHIQGVLQIEVHKNQIKIQSGASPDPQGRPLDYKTRLDENEAARIINDATIFIGETYARNTAKRPE